MIDERPDGGSGAGQPGPDQEQRRAVGRTKAARVIRITPGDPQAKLNQGHCYIARSATQAHDELNIANTALFANNPLVWTANRIGAGSGQKNV